jgi:hypothetical protein
VRVIYPSGKTALLRGQVDLMVDTIKVALVAGYTYDDTDTTLADIGTLAAPGVIVSMTSVSNGQAVCADVTFTALTGSSDITGLVIYQDPDTLLAYVDGRADTVPISITPNGADVTFTFDYLIKI